MLQNQPSKEQLLEENLPSFFFLFNLSRAVLLLITVTAHCDIEVLCSQTYSYLF